MELKNSQIVNGFPVLLKLANFDLPIKQSYNLKKTIRNLKSTAELLEQQRVDLVKKYGKDLGDGNISVNESNEENKNKFYSEYKVLLDIKDDYNIYLLNMDHLDNAMLSANDLDYIEFIFP